MTCMHSKSQSHHPYGLLKQLLIPEQPWNSISMDFIEQLLKSSRYTAILVVVDCFTKQAIFIPTHDTITSADLSKLFILHVFSKHGVSSHVTSNHGSEFISHFFRSLEKHWMCDSTLPWAIIWKVMGRLSKPTRPWNSTSGCIVTINRITGQIYFPLQNSLTIMPLA